MKRHKGGSRRQVICTGSKDEGSSNMKLKEVDEVRAGVLEHLKVLEFKGYSDAAIEDKLIKYVIKNADHHHYQPMFPIRTRFSR
ncbi:hypothetical protein LINPERPRIM_LOCUS9296 [Linum perenne]